MNQSNGAGPGYHWSQVHVRNEISPHFLDFHHYPPSFKSYGPSTTIPLERPGPLHESEPRYQNDRSGAGVFSLDGLADILFFAYGVISARQNSPVPFYQRTLPSAGGLYPCHLYLGLESGPGPEPDLERDPPNTASVPETGLYYYDPVHSRLVQLRSWRRPETGSGHSRAVFFITASYYNSTWKYRGRAYRYMLLDGGHLVRNLELILAARGADVRVRYRLPGDETAGLLGIDTDKEAVLACVSLGWDKSVPEIVSRLAGVTRPASVIVDTDPAHDRYLEAYSDLAAVHAGSLAGQVEAVELPVTDTRAVRTLSLDSAGLPDPGPRRLNRLILGRRSRRHFTSARLDRDVYNDLFNWLNPVRKNEKSLHRFLRLGMICQNLEGLDDGFYLFGRKFDRMSLMVPGSLAAGLARVCLDQAWIGRAAVSFLCLTCPDLLETDSGNAGYRHMMLDAGRLGQQIYLGAEALGLGCCGVGAIYDYEAQSLLRLSPGAALVYALCVGHKA